MKTNTATDRVFYGEQNQPKNRRGNRCRHSQAYEPAHYRTHQFCPMGAVR